jgi:murein DD-endopeptidase MepM/ murein hydrolase activator NlpD
VRALTGRLSVAPRTFDVQHLTLPRGMVDLDPQTERRANAESARLRALYRTVTPERLWREAFVRPLAGSGPGTGFGARRVINGQPRAPHTGADYAAPSGSPVLAANAGRVALVDEFFFPGRLVVIDHGLGLYTLYFHLEAIGVSAGQAVERGQSIGTVGATGRATGPHLHFGAQVGEARVDPTALIEIGGLDGSPPLPRALGTRLAPR